VLPLMRRWHEIERISFDRVIDPSDVDRLHQSDWSAQRIGQALCEVIWDPAAALTKMSLMATGSMSGHRYLTYSQLTSENPVHAATT
jgi:hypothetical protein